MNKKIAWTLVLLLFSCNSVENAHQSVTKNLSFYHWKNESNLSPIENDYLEKLSVDELYFRFFDIDVNEQNQAHPISVIRELDQGFKDFRIVPVVFITNKTFKNRSSVDDLVMKVHELLDQMYQHHFNRLPTKIQIDCDWTASTKDKYFLFLAKLKEYYRVSVTIRLHQIKYANKTGVPPADEGTLMAYNMGDLKEVESNSVFSIDVLKRYIAKDASYPLDLDIALPLFSWGIVTLPDKSIKIINNLTRKDILQNDSSFVAINERAYEVKHPCFLKGFYLPHNTIVKAEGVTFDEVLEAKKYLESCNKFSWKNTLLYHLDEAVLQGFSVDELLQLK